MTRHHLSRARVELNLLVNTDIDLREIVLVEVSLQHFTILEDMLLLELRLRSKDKPSGVELLVLRIDGLRLLVGLLRQVRHIGVQVGYLLVKTGDMDILGIQFLDEILNLLVLLLYLFHHVLDGCLQRITLDGALAQLLTQFVDQFLVASHRILDKLHILTDTLLGISTLTLTSQCHTSFGSIDFTETGLDVVEGLHHTVDLIILLTDNLVERVAQRSHLQVFVGLLLSASNH